MRTLSLLLVTLTCAAIAMSGCSTSTETASSGGGGGRSGGALVVPGVINFDSVIIGQIRDTVVPFVNTSTDSITITSNGLSGVEVHDTNFFKPTVIGANGFHGYHIQFDAGGNGLRTANDTIHYTSGGTAAVAIMTLTGTAAGGTTGGGGGGPLISIPSSVSFGSATVGQSRDTVLAIYNPSAGNPVTILSNQTTSGELVDTNFRGSLTLASGRGIVIHVQFTPSQAGLRSATDEITYMSGSTVQTLSIVFTAQAVTGGGTGGGTTPGPGSTFTYHYTSDTNNIALPASDSTFTVVSNSALYQGKTNVMTMRSQSGTLSYDHVESNGDVSTYLDLSQASVLLQSIGIGSALPSGWFTIPISSKKEITQTLIDTTMTLSVFPLPLRIVISTDAKYVASPQVVAAGKTFATDEGSLTLTISATSSLGGISVFSSSNTTSIFYSKTLQYYPKRLDQSTTQQTLPQQVTSTSSDTYLLTRYTLQ